MPNPLENAGIFLINTLFDLYLFVLVLRMVLVATRVQFYNPLSQVVVKLTQPLITPLRRTIPNYKQLELATLVIIIVLELVKFSLLSVFLHITPNVVGLIVLGIADALKTGVNIFFYAIIIQAILSWVNAGYSPVADVLHQITAPIIRPFQRLLPPVSGLDLSPIPAMIFLQLTLILLISPLLVMGQSMAFG